MGFAENLHNLRAKKNLTQKQLAEKLNVSLRTIQHYEFGRCLPRKDKLTKLCEILDTTKEELFKNQSFYGIDTTPEVQIPDKDVYQLVSEISGFFAGGTLPQEDKDAVMAAIISAYERSKHDNT